VDTVLYILYCIYMLWLESTMPSSASSTLLKSPPSSVRSLGKGFSFGEGAVELDGNRRHRCDNNSDGENNNKKNDQSGDSDDARAAPPLPLPPQQQQRRRPSSSSSSRRPPPLKQQVTVETSATSDSEEFAPERDFDFDNNSDIEACPYPPELLLGGEPSLVELGPDGELALVRRMWTRLSLEDRASLPDPAALVRHLRAEDGDADAAVDKVRNTLRWRREFGVDEIASCMDDPSSSKLAAMMERENATGKIYVRGYDSDGRALLYMRPGRENTGNADDNMKHLVWNLEKAAACTRRKSGDDKRLEKIVLMIDYTGFRIRDSPPLSTSKHTLEILQKHYPERMHRAYVLKPPLYFKTFWAIIKPFVDPSTKKKIVLVSNEAAMDELRDAMGPDGVRKLEPVAGGPPSGRLSEEEEVRDFVSSEYLRLPFDVAFDE